jgi:NADH dehydrogenase
VTGLDLESKMVFGKENKLHYDYLVVGIGGSPRTNNISGLKEYGFFLFDWAGTFSLRKHIEKQFEEYSQNPSGPLNLVVGGTGFTGIEFIHELNRRIPVLCKQFNVEPGQVHVIIVEENSGILQGYPESVIIDSQKSLEKLGCEYKLETSVSIVEAERVILSDGSDIPTKTFIWAGGVTGNPLLENLGFELLDGRVIVNEYCEVPGYTDVFILGDAAVSFDENGKPYPPTAQIAIQEGQYCAYNLAMKIYGQPVKPFHYIYRGMVLALGKGNASGIVYNHHINGHFGAFMKRLIEIRYYFMLGGLPLVRMKWKH